MIQIAFLEFQNLWIILEEKFREIVFLLLLYIYICFLNSWKCKQAAVQLYGHLCVFLFVFVMMQRKNAIQVMQREEAPFF